MLRGIKRIKKRLADGSERIYYFYRHTGHRIHGEPGTPEFLKSYHRAKAVATSRWGKPPGPEERQIQGPLPVSAFIRVDKSRLMAGR